jgi:hypothetical protein
LRWFEIGVAAALGVLGVRSLVHWLREPFAGRDATDHLLFALFVVGRVGIWWALAGLFAIYESVSARLVGRAFADEIRIRFWWYPMVVLAAAVLQFVAGVMLGRRGEPAGGDVRTDQAGSSTEP